MGLTATLCCGCPADWPSTFLQHSKKLATVIVLLSVVYHASNRLSHDSTCTSLFTTGSFLFGETWQPDDCQMHEYTLQDTQQCLKAASAATKSNTRFVLVGDSVLGSIFSRTLQHLQLNWEDKGNLVRVMDCSNGLNCNYNLTMKYYFNYLLKKDDVMDLIYQIKQSPPSLLLLGSMVDYVNEPLPPEILSTKILEDYKDGLEQLVKEIGVLDRKIPVIYKLSQTEEQQTASRKSITKLYNKEAIKILAPSRIILWHSALNSEIMDQYFVQMLWNFHCNQYLLGLPSNTCCQHIIDKSHAANLVIIATGLTALALVYLCGIRKRAQTPPTEKTAVGGVEELGQSTRENTNFQADSGGLLSKNNSNNQDYKKRAQSLDRVVFAKKPGILKTTNQNSGFINCFIGEQEKRLEIIWSSLKLGLILVYFVMCDRVIWFETGGKEYSLLAFGVPLGVAVMVAIFTAKSLPETKSDQQMLNIFVSDEWKGWMMVVIIVYHYTGASQNISIYMHLRILVSAYLFLTGYGHFSTYWSTGEAGGVIRYCQTMFRLNFLTVLLCLVMNQPYMNYYFITLVTFWFTVLHVALTLPPTIGGRGVDRTMADYGRAMFKIALIAACVVVLSLSEGMFMRVFGFWPLKLVFHLPNEESVEEWRFRWMLDRFSVLYGMVFALILQAWKQFWPRTTSDKVWPGDKTRAVVVGLVSSFCVCSYIILLHLCNGKESCNTLHPYFAWIPILGYIFFRHNTNLLRKHFSPMFAWLGSISLELFVSQYHILLALNTHGVLVLVPGPMNVLVTGFVYLCVTHELKLITDILQKVIVPSDFRVIAINLILLTLAVAGLAYTNLISVYFV